MAEEIANLTTLLVFAAFNFNELCINIKNFFGLAATEIFPAIKVLEEFLFEKDPKYTFLIEKDEEWKHGKNVQACYIHQKQEHSIVIRESVYNKALNNDESAILCITHEISHWYIINVFKLNMFLEQSTTSLLRNVFLIVHENMANLLACNLLYDIQNIEKVPCQNGNYPLAIALEYIKNTDCIKQFVNEGRLTEYYQIKTRREQTMALEPAKKTAPFSFQ